MEKEGEERNKDKEMVDSIKNMSEEIEKKYDQKMSEMNPEDDDGPDFTELENKYNDLKKDISEARRNGKDMFVPHNLILSFPTQSKIAEATEDPADVDKAEQLLDEVHKEYRKALDRKEVDVRKEILERLGEVQEDDDEDLGEGIIPDEYEEDEYVKLEKEPDTPEEYFHLEDKSIKNLKELREALKEMDNRLFQYYYVSQGKNDFAEWIEHSLNYPILAKKIRKVRDKEEVRKIIKKEADQ